MSRPPRIAFLAGSDEHCRQDWSNVLNLDLKGSTDLFKLLGMPNRDSFILHFAKSYFRQSKRHHLSSYDLLINLVTDADQNSKVLNVLSKALKGCPVPVLNHPDRVRMTTRDGAAQALCGIGGLIVPRVVRLQSPSPAAVRAMNDQGKLRFPFILRRAGTHGGQIIGLITDPDQVPTLPRDSAGFTATEFVDFRSADGLYRKYRVFVIGGELVFRHLLISDHWNIHMADRARFMMPRPELIAESQAYYARGAEALQPFVRNTLAAMADRLMQDFFGVDFGLAPDGRIVLFEANATMNYLPISSDPKLAAMRLCVPPAQQALARLIESRAKTTQAQQQT